MYYFTADEHYWHRNIIKYCARPFPSIEENNEAIIERNNEVVGDNDIVIHGGDTTLLSKLKFQKANILQRLKGKHVFLKGSHDSWLPDSAITRWEKHIDDIYVVVDHYAGRVWPRSHYGSWQLFGHSHGNLEAWENQHDIGVDNNNFYPVSFDELKEIMKYATRS